MTIAELMKARIKYKREEEMRRTTSEHCNKWKKSWCELLEIDENRIDSLESLKFHITNHIIFGEDDISTSNYLDKLLNNQEKVCETIYFQESFKDFLIND